MFGDALTGSTRQTGGAPTVMHLCAASTAGMYVARMTGVKSDGYNTLRLEHAKMEPLTR